MPDKQEKPSRPWYALFRHKGDKNELGSPTAGKSLGLKLTILSSIGHRGVNAGSSDSASADAKSLTMGFAKPPKEVFGVPLPSDLANMPLYAYNPKHFIHGIPVVLYKVMEFLVQKGEDVDFFDGKVCSSAHVAAAALKLYLRELPEPLITYDLYDCLQKSYAAVDSPEERLKRLRSIIYILPNLNYECLALLARFLNKVAEYADVNKMSSANLAICFAPNVIRVENESGASSALFDTPNATLIMKTLIDESDYLFEEDDPASPSCSILQCHRRALLAAQEEPGSVSAPAATPVLSKSIVTMGSSKPKPACPVPSTHGRLQRQDSFQHDAGGNGRALSLSDEATEGMEMELGASTVPAASDEPLVGPGGSA